MTKNRVWETMTTLKTKGSKIRIWRESAVFKRGPEEDILDFWAETGLTLFSKYGAENLILRLEAEFPNISAIEVVNVEGDGVLLYPDWK